MAKCPVYIGWIELKQIDKVYMNKRFCFPVKSLWSTPPDDWPAHLIHVDPNNPGKDSMCGKTGTSFTYDFLATLQTWYKFVSLLFHPELSDCYTFLYVPRQHRYHGVCNSL